MCKINKVIVSKTKKYKIYIDISGLPKPANQLLRKNYWIIKKEKDLWHNIIGDTIRLFKPPVPLESASITLTRHSSVCPDPDGLVSSFKYILDSLVACGIIKDDKYKYIGMPTYLWVKSKPKKGRFEVLVEAK